MFELSRKKEFILVNIITRKDQIFSLLTFEATGDKQNDYENHG
jgi:hypothetical protein